MDDPPTEEAPLHLLKKSSGDIGWDYGCMIDPTNSDRLRCMLCGKEMTGGIFRMKEHIAHVKGNIAPCRRSSKEDKAKCMKVLLEAKEKKILKRKHDEVLRSEVNLSKDSVIEELERELGHRKSPHFQGPMDNFATTINPEATSAGQKRQQSIHDAISKENSHQVHQYCACWIYNSNIAFNAIDNDDFRLFCEALGQFGPGWQPPTQYKFNF